MISIEKANFIKKLLYQSKNRGCKETDLILGRFADHHLNDMDPGQLQKFAEILGLNDADIYDYVTSKRPVPEHLKSEIMEQLLNFDVSKKQ